MATNQSGNLNGGLSPVIPVSGGISGNADLSGNLASTAIVDGGVDSLISILGNVSSSAALTGSIGCGGRSIKEVVSATTAQWNAQIHLVSAKDVIYVYTDYEIVDGQPIPNLKIGDGNAYLIDLPFISSCGITQEQINFWNNKVSIKIDENDPENVIFYTDMLGGI